ncbi:MAG: gliding motility-associated C-terminal domain-containing protein [Bacteroides sp.]|jgi:gliding motility-associated-like protein|nr:gliding motility-associated C-terminal domain-containing protein [Bacteroides sp.]
MGKDFFFRLFLQGFFLFLFLNGFGQSEDFLRINSVSVLPGGEVIVDWTLQTDVTEGFIEVNRKLGDFYVTIEENLPLSQASYTDISIDANLGAYSYYVAAFAIDGSTIAPSQAHQTIFLFEPDADFCSGDIRLQWTNYAVTTSTGTPQPLEVPFDLVRVQYSSDGQNFTTFETFDQPPTSDNVQEYSFEGLEPGQHFFRIQSFNSETEVVSNSNIRVYGYDPPQLEDFKIDYIDVFENEEVQVLFVGSGDTGAYEYEVFRSEDAGGSYDLIAGDVPLEVFQDNPDLSQGPWFYRVKAWLKDWECGAPAYETPEVFSSIFLQGSPGTESREFLFNWQHYYPEALRFQYEVQMETGEGVWEIAPGVFDAGSQEYVFTAPLDLAGIFVFRVLAFEQSQPSRLIASNYVTIEVEPFVFIPNAFRPTSNNPDNQVFKPQFPGFDPDVYELIIFNRWGQQIFSSTDPEIGWDGNYDGHTASPGVYPFQLRYQVPGGKSNEESGVVTLVNDHL